MVVVAAAAAGCDVVPPPPVVVWKVRNAWPSKVDGPTLNSTGNEVAIETVELAHEGLSIEFT